MLRFHFERLVLICAVVSIAACSKGEDSSKPEGNALAGEVVEVAGKVVAVSEGAERALAVGDKVKANDTIVTEADAKVAIRLFHNGARLELGGGKRRKLRESLAWNAPKGKNSGTSSDKTMAAGRHAERQAGTTTPVRSAEKKSEEPTAADREPGNVAAKADPVDKAVQAKQTQRNLQAQMEAKAKLAEALRRKQEEVTRAQKELARRQQAELAKRREMLARRRAKRKKVRRFRNNGKGGGAGDDNDPLNGLGATTTSSHSSASARARLAGVSVAGGVSRKVVRAQVLRRLNALRGCYKTKLKTNKSLAGMLSVRATLSTSGMFTKFSVRGDSALRSAIGRCVVGHLRRVRLPKPQAPAQVSLSLLFSH